MGTIVEATLPTSELALEATTEELPDITFQLERVVAQDPESILPFMWVSGVEQDTFEDVLDTDPSVESFELVTDLGATWLYQMNWVDRIEALIQTIVEEEAILLEAKGSGGMWELKFLFLERKAIKRVRDHFENEGIPFEAHRIYDQREGNLGARGLTEKQHQRLTLALEQGYYEVPRRVDTVTLASEVGISHQSLSEQFRRAHGIVIEDAIGMNNSVLSNGNSDK